MTRLAALAAALALTGIAHAGEHPAALRLDRLTSNEVRDIVAKGTTTILVPIGGTEQNGPHMALGKHNARAEELALRIAGKLGNAVVAPVIAYVPEGAIDPPTAHMKYPGTISIPVDAFEKTLEGAARSFRHAGFTDVVFLGDHGGYAKSLANVGARLNKEWGGKAHVHVPGAYYRELPHAGRDDTALTLGLGLEALVRPDKAGPQAAGHGAAQDPSGATREAGVAMAQDIVDRTVESLKKATAHR
jgi:creatinine amidohydrolase/Fe(II)-dependent formamide hydrolase-like protein